MTITAADLKDRRTAAQHGDAEHPRETDRLKARLAKVRDRRVPFYLSRDEFLAICRWKLADQYARSAAALESSGEKRVKRTTQLAFACRDKDAAFELAGRVTILRLLPGVGIGLATAILALCYPKRYAALDAAVWQAVFDEPRKALELAEYARFLTRIEELTAEARKVDPKGKWTVQLTGYYAGDQSEAARA